MELSKTKFAALLAVILILGLFLRFYSYGIPSIESTDSPLTIAGGLTWFYPPGYYPGLVHWQPPVGHFFVGLGCMASGQDFSGASNVSSYFKPTLPILIGEAVTSSAHYCLLPIYLFGVFFLLGSAILFFSMFGRRISTLYAISFVAFFPFILWFSRFVHIDVINWAFVVFGFLFSWMGYRSSEKTELVYFSLAMVMFGLGTATKFTSGIFLLFGLFLYLEKRFIGKKSARKLKVSDIINIAVFLLVFFSVFLLPFGFNPKNVEDVYRAHASVYSVHLQIGPSLAFLPSFYEFLAYSSPFDFFIFLYSVFIFFILLLKRGKTERERFILYSFLLFLFIMIFFGNASSTLYLVIPAYLGVIMLMALSLDGTGYSVVSKLKKYKKYLPAFIIIYVLFGFFSNLMVSPNYLLNTNLMFRGATGHYELYGERTVELADYLKGILKDNETFYYPDCRHDILYFYIHKDYQMVGYIFDVKFREQAGRDPNILERVNMFEYGGKKIRYLILNKMREYSDEHLNLALETCAPIKTIPVKGDGMDEVLVYDLNTCNVS